MNKEQLHLLIDSYLTTRKESVDSGWPEVTNIEKAQLLDIIHTLIRLKYEVDCDGDPVIRYALCDRTKDRWMYPLTVPQKHGIEKIKGLVSAINSIGEELDYEIRCTKDIVPKYDYDD